MLAAAESLGLPFETTRRHIAEMIDIGLCRRDRGGIMSQVSFDDEPWSALFIEAHDSLVRFVEDMRAIDALPCFPSSARSYDWNHGLAATADLMLAVADGNQGTHHDRLDLVVFSTVMAASQRRVTIDLALSRQHRMIAAPPPSHLVRPVRARRVADALGLSEATVRRRVDRLIEGPLEVVDGGLIPRETWISSSPAQMKMFLTRFGQNSRMVICGDPNQTDLPGGVAASGLADATFRLEGVEGISMCRFTAADVVRHPIVGRIVEAYEGQDA